MEPSSSSQRSNFSGRLGYILATAGSAVGLGNIWRFPYLAARHGGGIFVLVYLILAFTFGYTMMTSETALGRLTRKSPVSAFAAFSRGRMARAGGWINAVVPMLILPYYCVIGGWVTRYFFLYLTHDAASVAADGDFSGFIASPMGAEIWFLVFAALTILIILLGAENGIERVSRVMMPALILLSVALAIYSVTRPGAMAGVRYLFVPDLANFSWKTVVAALGQMFYSLSIAMGALITYGSYMKKDVDIERATLSVVSLDSGVAVLAGLMIVPAVFAFSGGDPAALNAGPGLMFVTMPRVFAGMAGGRLVAALFFLLVLFAALTSSISLAEACASTFQDELGWKRGPATALTAVIVLVLGSLSSLGFGPLDFVKLLGMDILDFFDFLTTAVLMPVAAFATCMLIVYAVGVKSVSEEVRLSSRFRLEGMYRPFVRVAAPVFVIVILLSSLAGVFGLLQL